MPHWFASLTFGETEFVHYLLSQSAVREMFEPSSAHGQMLAKLEAKLGRRLFPLSSESRGYGS